MTLPHTLILGSGIIGACAAHALISRGHRITLIDAATPGGEQAASYGNGAWISPASVVPMSMPGLWRKIPRLLLDREGPLTLRASALPTLAPWLTRFVAAGNSVEKVERTASELSTYLRNAPALHQALARSIGRPEFIAQQGLLYAYPDRAEFEAEVLAWRLRRNNGVAPELLDEAALRSKLPMLSPHYRYGALVHEGANVTNPGAYVQAIVDNCLQRGAEFVSMRAMDFELNADSSQSGRRVVAVTGKRGPDHVRIECDNVVIASGMGSKALAAKLGETVHLASERGYHVEITTPPFELPVPIMPSDGKMANTSLTSGLRLAGQVELAPVNDPPDWRRAEILLNHAKRSYPALADVKLENTKLWLGHRPSSSNGLPIARRAQNANNVVYAFGHGHVGLAAAPATAERVVTLVQQRTDL